MGDDASNNLSSVRGHLRVTAVLVHQAGQGHQRLSGSVAHILEKGRYRSEDLLREAQLLITVHLRQERVDILEDIT